MANQEIRYRLKAKDGTFWAYGNSFTKAGKSFRSIPTMMHEFKRNRKNQNLELTIEQVTMGVIATDFLDISDEYSRVKVHSYLQDEHGTHVANFYRDNGNSFAPYEYLIDLFYLEGHIDEVITRLKASGFNARSYKKKQHVIYTTSSDLVTFVEMAFNQDKRRPPAVINLADLQIKLNKISDDAKDEVRKW